MLSVHGLCAEYPGEHGAAIKAAQDISFQVPEGKWFTLLGPSGCGKTTTLRSIAGLERPTAGEISVRGRVLYSAAARTLVPPNRRNFGMVFQSYAIWPHMNVFQNAAFPLEVRPGRPGRREIAERVMRVLRAVGLAELADREATKLSGGQQQRLALARALVMEPDLLLLDEPLSNLDAKLRARMCFELKRLQRELELTTIYVTHDQTEALALSHAIAVMNEGRIVQIGSPREIYERPRNRFVADFVGTTNFLEGTVGAAEAPDGRYRVSTDLGEFSAQAAGPLRGGDRVALSVRPEHIHLSENRLDAALGGNVCEGTVGARVFLGERVDFQVRVGERVLLARAHPSLPTRVGEKIFLRVDPDTCIAIPDPGA